MQDDFLDNMKLPTEAEMFDGYLLKFKTSKVFYRHNAPDFQSKNCLLNFWQYSTLMAFIHVLKEHGDVESIEKIDFETYKKLESENNIGKL